jgi:hypothetical protein
LLLLAAPALNADVKWRKLAQMMSFWWAVLALGCVSTRSIRYEAVGRASRPKDAAIEVLDLHDICRPYKVIGIVEANAGKLHNNEDTLNHLKKEAGKIGADAITELDVGEGSGVVAAPAGGTWVAGRPRKNWRAKAIVWQDNLKQPAEGANIGR